jgi:hypothetical protein
LFEPPKVGGKPVEVRVMIPFRFTPPDEETMNKQRDEHDT